MPSIEQESVISELEHSRSELLNDIAGLELQMIEVRLPLLRISQEEITADQIKEVRHQFLELRDRRDYLEAELLIVDSKLALARRHHAELRSVDQTE